VRWVLALAVSLVAGIWPIWWMTDGFSVLTAEDARREAVARSPRPIPDVRVIEADGRMASLRRALEDDGRVAIVSFFYSRCTSLCLAQGSQVERLQRAIYDRGLDARVRLLSISFDPRDHARELTSYAQRMHAQPGVWQFLALPDGPQHDRLLSLFGIVVVPAPLGQFEHNAAFHVVTPQGRLARIVDLDEPGEALHVAEILAGQGVAR